MFSLLIKPCGPDCNLACRHCFYSSKTEIFGSGAHRMKTELLDRMIKDFVGLKFPVSMFAWQGGEPTLMGLDFFRQAIELQKKYGTGGQVVSNALQTNGTLLEEAWCEFLRENKFLVGISLDGPAEMHDHYRRGRAGEGSFGRVMRSIELLKANRVEFNVLTLLTDRNVNAADEVFAFLAGNGITYMQFIPCFEREDGRAANYSITPEEYGRLLCRLVDLWLAYGWRKISIRLFDSLLSYLIDGRAAMCTFQRRCDDYVVVEHNGDVFACDFFVEPGWKLGNLLENPLDELARSPKKQQFSRYKAGVSNSCLVCRWLEYCRGGCLKERAFEHGDFKEKSYFCQSYRMFFEYAEPKFMALLPEIAEIRKLRRSK